MSYLYLQVFVIGVVLLLLSVCTQHVSIIQVISEHHFVLEETTLKTIYRNYPVIKDFNDGDVRVSFLSFLGVR